MWLLTNRPLDGACACACVCARVRVWPRRSARRALAQADVHRDRKGSYWDTARKADSMIGYQPEALWYRDATRGNVRAMTRGVN